MTVTVGYLGPEGTFAHQATDLVTGVGPDACFEPWATVQSLVHDVDEGAVPYGLVPLENSVEGGVHGTLDILVFEVARARICEEVVVPVTFGAHRRADDADAAARRVLSHPVGLAQCRHWWSAAGLEPTETSSTAEACRTVGASGEAGLVAIASAKAAELAGLVTSETGIEDYPGAQTRFALLGTAEVEPTGDDRTTLVITPPSEGVGILMRTLAPISERGVNISTIVSRPLRQRLGEYCFVLTIDRHERDGAVTGAIEELIADGFGVKVLGSYPAFGVAG